MDQKHDAGLELAIAQWENEGGACCGDTAALEEDEPTPADDD